MVILNAGRVPGWFGAMTAALVILAVPAAGQSVRTCLPDDDVTAGLLALVQDVRSDSSSYGVRFRAQIGMSATAGVSLVHDDTTCNAVTASLNASQVNAKIVVRSASPLPRYFAATYLNRVFGAVKVVDENYVLLATIGVGGEGMPSSEGSGTQTAATPGAALARSAWTLAASSTWEYGGALSEAIDASVSSYWKSGAVVTPGATYFAIDTHTSQTLGALRVNDSQFADELPLAGNVMLSTDGTSYTQAAQWSSANISGGLLEISWTPTTARYVKLVATQTPAVASNWFTIADVRLYASLPEVLWTGSASGSAYGEPISGALDGNPGTRWASGASVTPNSTFVLADAHTTGSFSSLRLDASQFSGDVPLSGDVLVSTNGSTFTRVAQWTATNIVSGVVTVSWTPQPARFIKLVATSTPSASSNWWSIGELTVSP